MRARVLARLLMAVAAAWIGLIPASALAQEVTLRVHHFLPPSSVTHTEVIVPWAEAVMAQSGGRIKVDIYPAMQLGGRPPQLYDQVRDGVVDVVWTLPGYNPGRFPIASVFELPFMVSSAEATSQAVQAFSARYLGEEFGDVKPLMFHVHERGSFHMRKVAVTRLEDLEGLKVRAASRAIGQALDALGGTPGFMPVPQVPQALAKGVVDGVLLPFEVTLPLKVHELVREHSVIEGPRGLYTAVFLFAMNKARYEGLPADLRQVIDDNSGIELARRAGQAWDRATLRGIAAAKARGNNFTTIAPAEVARIRAATQPVTDAWVADMDARGLDGAAMLEEARALIRQYSRE